MLDLSTVTLCCVDTLNHALALRALALSRREIRFARSVLVTDGLPAGLALPEGIELARIDPLASRDAYSQFVLKELGRFVDTPHVLLIQWDGYVVNPQAWDPAFLGCDYLGAKWYWHDDGMRVGNGGFSLRSRRLLDALRDPRIALVEAEDETICRTHRPLLEREYGIVFGSEAAADRFSFEAAYPVGKPFGFHGLYNFCRTVPPDEIAALAPGFSDAIARSLQLASLLRNCMALGQWRAAAAIARRTLAAKPDDADAARQLADAERNLATIPAAGRNDPCPCGSGRKYKQCHGALGAAAPAPSADALAQAGVALHQKGDLEGAEAKYRAALEQDAAHAVALHYLGVIRYQRGRHDEALPLLQRAVERVPGEPEFHNNLGLVLAATDRNDEAIAAYRAALAIKPDHVGAWNNLGLALQAENRVAEAIAAFREAVARAPQFAQSHWNLSLALLLDGQYAEGWREYEARLAVRELQRNDRVAAAPRWDGVVRPGMTLLLTSEQGLGDALQFIRYAADAAARGIRVLVQAEAPLKSLLGTAPGVGGSFGPDDALPAVDAQLPLLSLPGVLGIEPDRNPARHPYIAADPARRARAAAALRRSGQRLAVGIAWAGNPAHRNDRRRSLPLAALSPLLALPGIDWRSLQKGAPAQEIAALPAAQALVPLPDDASFDDTAALVAELDLVITVDTSVAHLAGALGRPVWILLPFAPDWRWRLGTEDSHWYPTARLFRQSRPGDWVGVVERLVKHLVEDRQSLVSASGGAGTATPH